MVWAVVAAFEWCSIDVGDNPLLVCGAALLVIGFAIYEISASRAYQISYGGVVVLVLGLLVQSMMVVQPPKHSEL